MAVKYLYFVGEGESKPDEPETKVPPALVLYVLVLPKLKRRTDAVGTLSPRHQHLMQRITAQPVPCV